MFLVLAGGCEAWQRAPGWDALNAPHCYSPPPRLFRSLESCRGSSGSAMNMAVPSTGCLPAAPLRSATRSRLAHPPASVSLPPPLPETLGVKAGACAVCWQPGARAQSPAGCHPSLRAPPRRYIRVTARPPAWPVPCGALQLAPSPSSPLPSVRAAPALSPSAPALRGVRSGPARPREAAAPAPSASPGGSVSAAACGEGGPGSPQPPRPTASAARPSSYHTFPPRPGRDGAASHLLLLRNFSRLCPLRRSEERPRGCRPGSAGGRRGSAAGNPQWGRAAGRALSGAGLWWGRGVPRCGTLAAGAVGQP